MRRSTTLVLVLLLIANLGLRGGAAHHNALVCSAGDGTARPHVHTSTDAHQHGDGPTHDHGGAPCGDHAPHYGPICFAGPCGSHDHSAVYFCGSAAVRASSRIDTADDNSLEYTLPIPAADAGQHDSPTCGQPIAGDERDRLAFPTSLRTVVLRL